MGPLERITASILPGLAVWSLGAPLLLSFRTLASTV